MSVLLGSARAISTWKRTLNGNPWRSVHFALAALFNAIVLICWFQFILICRTTISVKPGFALAAISILLLLLLAGAFAKQAFSLARHYVDDRAKRTLSEPMATISYLAFRLYLLVLGVAFMLLSLARIASTS